MVGGGLDAFLENFTEKLMADCHSGYQRIKLRTGGDIQQSACITDARRKVFRAAEA